MGAQQSLQRYQDRLVVEAAAEGRLDGVAVSRSLFEARGLGLVKLPAGLVARMADASIVDVSENRFVYFPAQICTLSSMRTLVAHDNQISELPRSFGDLYGITELDLSRNMLAGELPASISNLRELRELRIQQNKLESLPGDIGNLSKLTRLALDHNVIDSLPESLTKLVHLRELGLSYNILTATHQHLDRLTALTRLDLSYNRLREIPPLEELKQLRMLSLESNKLRGQLPPLCFRPLRSLTSLSLGGADNRIPSLPTTLTGYMGNLTLPRSAVDSRRDAEGQGAAAARVAERAAVVAGADEGAELLIDPIHDPRVPRVRPGAKLGGRIVTAHQVVSLLAAAGSAVKDDWEGIDLIRRGLQLGAQISKQQQARLEEEEDDDRGALGLDGGGAAGAGAASAALAGRRRGAASATATAPGEGAEEDAVEDPTLVQLGRLHTLALQRCGLRHLPAAFGSFRSLTALDVSNNKHLKTLPEDITRGMPLLDTFLARACGLEALPTSLGRLSSLTCLHVPLNKLTVLPPSIGRLRRLTELDASGNASLIDLPEQMSQGCVRLQTIRLGECSGLNLPNNLVELASLTSITVAARQVAVAAAEVRELLESGRIEVTLT